MPSGHRGQLAAACPGPRKMVPFWTFFEAFWSSLKHFEAVWNSLNSRSRNSLKQSEADWSQAQYYMAQLRSLTTQGLHFSLLGINLLNLSHRHSRNHTFELLRGQKQDLQMTKKACLHLTTWGIDGGWCHFLDFPKCRFGIAPNSPNSLTQTV